MILKWLRVSVLALLIPAAAHAASETLNLSGNGAPWTLMLRNDAGTGYSDRIQLHARSYSVIYYMDQADVTPSRFALTYNTLKDYLLNGSSIKLVIEYTPAGNQRRIERLELSKP